MKECAATKREGRPRIEERCLDPRLGELAQVCAGMLAERRNARTISRRDELKPEDQDRQPGSPGAEGVGPRPGRRQVQRLASVRIRVMLTLSSDLGP